MMLGDAHEGEMVGAGLARWARQKLLVFDTDKAEAGGVLLGCITIVCFFCNKQFGFAINSSVFAVLCVSCYA
jgi:hypothetical protein